MLSGGRGYSLAGASMLIPSLPAARQWNLRGPHLVVGDDDTPICGGTQDEADLQQAHSGRVARTLRTDWPNAA